MYHRVRHCVIFGFHLTLNTCRVRLVYLLVPVQRATIIIQTTKMTNNNTICRFNCEYCKRLYTNG